MEKLKKAYEDTKTIVEHYREGAYVVAAAGAAVGCSGMALLQWVF